MLLAVTDPIFRLAGHRRYNHDKASVVNRNVSVRAESMWPEMAGTTEPGSVSLVDHNENIVRSLTMSLIEAMYCSNGL
jgi:hypothetical protein